MSYDDENFTRTQDIDALSEEWRESSAQRRAQEEEEQGSDPREPGLEESWPTFYLRTGKLTVSPSAVAAVFEHAPGKDPRLKPGCLLYLHGTAEPIALPDHYGFEVLDRLGVRSSKR